MNLKLTNFLLTGDYSKFLLFISKNTSSLEEAEKSILEGLKEAKAFGINSEKIKKDILKRFRESSFKEIPSDEEFSREIAKRVYEQKGAHCILFIFIFIVLFIFII